LGERFSFEKCNEEEKLFDDEQAVYLVCLDVVRG
jgi:hypothetical protein